MRFRSLCTAHTIAVAPLLRLAPSVVPSAADLSKYVLRLDADVSKVGPGGLAAAGGADLASLPSLALLGTSTRGGVDRAGQGVLKQCTHGKGWFSAAQATRSSRSEAGRGLAEKARRGAKDSWLRPAPTLPPLLKALILVLVPALDPACPVLQAGEGVVLQQVSCLTGGADCGWRIQAIRNPGDGASSAPAAGAAAARSAAPGLHLQPGDSTTQFFQLSCPLPSPPAAAAAAAADGGRSSGNEAVAVFTGPANHFHRAGGAADASVLPGRGSAAALGASSGVATPDAPGTPSQARSPRRARGAAAQAAAAGAAAAAAAAAVAAPQAELPVDAMVVWSVPVSQQVGGPRGGGARVGALHFYDLCAALRGEPLRMLLEAQTGGAWAGGGGSGGGVVRHDFRASSLCVVPVRLLLRNCGRGAADVSVCAGASAGGELQNAWTSISALGGRQQAAAQQAAAPASAPATPPGSLAASRAPTPLGGPSAPPLGSGAAAVGAPRAVETAAGAGSAGGAQQPQQQPSQQQQPMSAAAAGAAAGTLRAGLPPAPAHVWCGRTRTRVGRVLPNCSTEVALQVRVLGPGVVCVWVSGSRRVRVVSLGLGGVVGGGARGGCLQPLLG